MMNDAMDRNWTAEYRVSVTPELWAMALRYWVCMLILVRENFHAA